MKQVGHGVIQFEIDCWLSRLDVEWFLGVMSRTNKTKINCSKTYNFEIQLKRRKFKDERWLKNHLKLFFSLGGILWKLQFLMVICLLVNFKFTGLVAIFSLRVKLRINEEFSWLKLDLLEELGSYTAQALSFLEKKKNWGILCSAHMPNVYKKNVDKRSE